MWPVIQETIELHQLSAAAVVPDGGLVVIHLSHDESMWSESPHII
jgi:hypothetical protein